MASSAGGSAIRPSVGHLTRQAAPPARRPVMADVARLAGVSHQTVSRVVNDHPNVRPQTRDNVLAAISKLAYRPNAAARTLVTRRTHTLGVISCDTDLFGPASMLYGIEQAAAGTYFVSIASLPAIDHGAALDAVERLLGQGVEGVIVIAPSTSAVAALGGMPPEVPLVAVGCGTSAPLASVAVDNIAGARSATEYLLSLGHRSVHFVSGPQTSLDGRERAIGWQQALAAAGLTPPPAADRGLVLAVRLRAGSPGSPRGPRSPRCSAPTTRWRWACCGPWPSTAGRCPTTSAWSASTTCRRPRTSARR